MSESYKDSRQRVESVVRKALQPSFAGPSLSQLTQAVVDGEGDKARIEDIEKTANAEPVDLVLFDTDQIGSYVFESSRPPVICGASLILKDLNEEIAKIFDKETVFSGGGEGLLITTRHEGARLCRKIEELYENRTQGALSVTTFSAPAWPSSFIPLSANAPFSHPELSLVSGTAAVLGRMRDEIRRIKSEKGPRAEFVGGARERCVACRDRAGLVPISKYRQNETGSLCRPCDQRWEIGKQRIAGFTLEELIKPFSTAEGDDRKRAKSNYVGFLYSDGNAMGSLFGNLSSLALLRFASGALSFLFGEAGSIVDSFIPDRLKTGPGNKEFLSFLGGGDEAIWILPAAIAVQAAERLPVAIHRSLDRVPEFRKLVLRPEGRETLSVGIGLVICEHKYPVRYQRQLAKQLLNSAKELFYASPEKEVSAIDFEVLTDASPLSENLETVRRIVFSSDDPRFHLTQRPYSAENFTSLSRIIRDSLSKGVPTAQLSALRRSAFEGRSVFTNHVRYQVARNDQKYVPWLAGLNVDAKDARQLDNFFVHPRNDRPDAIARTWLLDALELRPFFER